MISGAFINKPIYSYPAPPILGKDITWWDTMGRTSLTPTGWPTIYTSANNGGGSTAFTGDSTGFWMRNTTSAGGAGEDVDVRTNAFLATIGDMSTNNDEFNLCKSIRFKFIFNATAATDIEGFVGILNDPAQISALPTTARHLGVYWDVSAGANFTLSSADGTTQITTDSTVAVDTALHILEIDWNSAASNTVRFYSIARALNATHNATSNININCPMTAHFFVQTEAAAAKSLDIKKWGYECLT